MLKGYTFIFSLKIFLLVQLCKSVVYQRSAVTSGYRVSLNYTIKQFYGSQLDYRQFFD